MVTLDETILSAYGGLENNSLTSLINSNEDDTEESPYIDMIQNSPYYDENNFNNIIEDKNTHFSLLSTNVESANAQIDELIIFIEQLREINFEFSVICLQECWITKEQDISHLKINGYTCICQCSSVGRKGGLITYLILGNIYRPPRNLIENIRTFNEELSDILTSMDHNNSEFFLTGDYNINLLSINDKEMNAEFLEMLCSLSFYPKITLPTRFSPHSGSLIDNVFCRLTNNTLHVSSGILLKQFSDHQPYFLFFNTLIKQKPSPKTVKVATNTPEALDKLYKELLEQDIMKQINTNPYSHPNVNYNILLSVLEESKQKHISAKIVKFHKHKHKKIEWITKGILKSIKYRDSLYKKIKISQIGTVEYNTNKINLCTYNKILKRSIRIAKINYYSSCFNKYKNDIKKTWQTISDIMNRKHTDTTYIQSSLK